MASAELQIVIDLLKANPPIQGSNVAEMRAAMDAMSAAIPPPEDITHTPVDAGGVPAEWSSADVADSGRVVIYFHGGAYVMGSIASHRILVAHIARRTGARVLNVDYRLGPEHPFPAAVDGAVAAYRFVRGSGVPASKIPAQQSAFPPGWIFRSRSAAGNPRRMSIRCSTSNSSRPVPTPISMASTRRLRPRHRSSRISAAYRLCSCRSAPPRPCSTSRSNS